MMPDLNGKWMGELIYDDSFGRLANEVLFFTLEIKNNEGEFSGVSCDVDGIGMYPSEALVSGFVSDEQINFVKEYKRVQQSDKIKENLSPISRLELSFSGAFNPENNLFEGSWFSLSDFRSFNNNTPGMLKGGTWRMSREGYANT